MKFNTLDKLVRETLIDKGYPMHYYVRFLNFAVGCLRELNWDTLSTIKSAEIAVNSYNAILIPCDYVDMIKLGVINGGHIAPWYQDDTLTLEYNTDASGSKVPHEDAVGNFMSQTDVVDYYPGVYTNEQGEFKGRAFNVGAGWSPFRYKVMPSRNEIQLATKPSDGLVVLEYITDGTTCDASNMIHPYASESIKLWIQWKHKENNRTYNISDRQKAEDQYYNELRKLRARLSPWTRQDVVNLLRGSLDASITQ